MVSGLVVNVNSSTESAALTLYHVARMSRVPMLPIDVHMYLSSLAGMNLAHNPHFVVSSKQELADVMKKRATEHLAGSIVYLYARDSGSFHMNRWAMLEGGYTTKTDWVGRPVSEKVDLGFLCMCYSLASIYSQRTRAPTKSDRIGPSSEATLFETLSASSEPFFNLLVDYYTFLTAHPDFKPSKRDAVYFRRDFRASLFEKERLKEIETTGTTSISKTAHPFLN